MKRRRARITPGGRPRAASRMSHSRIVQCLDLFRVPGRRRGDTTPVTDLSLAQSRTAEAQPIDGLRASVICHPGHQRSTAECALKATRTRVTVSYFSLPGAE